MGLELKSTATGKILASFNEVEVEYLNLKFFQSFNDKFNGLIDLYGNFRLYNNHLVELQKLLLEESDEISKSLLKVVNNAIISNDVLIGIGD